MIYAINVFRNEGEIHMVMMIIFFYNFLLVNILQLTIKSQHLQSNKNLMFVILSRRNDD